MSIKQIGKKTFNQAEKAILTQSHQIAASSQSISGINTSLDELLESSSQNIDSLDALLAQAETLCTQENIDITTIVEKDIEDGLEMISLSEEDERKISVPQFTKIETVETNINNWDKYIENVESYAQNNKIDLSQNILGALLTSTVTSEISERIRNDYTLKQANCDKYDYLIAAFCGIASGVVDSFFVGMPGRSKLGKWTDSQTDALVENFSKTVWKADNKQGIATSKKEPEGIASAIGYLERRFKVNYDARYAADLNLNEQSLGMNPKNHHIMSLGHAPDLIGLFFSILDQFTKKASFISNGQLIRAEPIEKSPGFVLQGETFLSKLFCGFCNWLGHLMSDVAGSSGTRGHINNKRGAGIPIPFFELFQFCDFGSFNVSGEQKNLSQLMIRTFESGYDIRHGAAMAIPVMINELFIRMLWVIKSRFYHNNDWEKCVPFGNHPELRRMLVVGHGSLCLVDSADAAIRSKGEFLTFALHMNLIAWSRFAFSAIQEIRSIYKANALDISALDYDLEQGWKTLFKEIRK